MPATTFEQIQQELIQSNEYMRIQIWILGGAITVILTIAAAFARSAWLDARTMLVSHEKRIQETEKHIAVLLDRSEV